MLTEIVSTVAEQLSAPSAKSVENALNLVLTGAGAARVSLAVFSTSGVELVSSSGRALLANGAQVPYEASSMFTAAAQGAVFWEQDIATLADFGRPVDRLMLASGFRAACSVPVTRGREALGALSVSHTGGPALSRDDLGGLETLSALFTMALGMRHVWPPPRVLVCHDSHLIAWGVARLLEQSAQAQVTVAADRREAILADGEFDVVISDVVVFGGSIASLLELCPAARRSRLIAFSGYDTAEQESAAFDAGAIAFLTERQAGDLPATVLAIRDGTFVPAQPPQLRRDSGLLRTGLLRPGLTRREGDVLVKLEAGLTNRQISRRLAISESTVQGYCRSLFGKLNVHSRTQAVRVAREQGILHRLRFTDGVPRA
jgi:DNA-binding NarL/FixJ family response regulator